MNKDEPVAGGAPTPVRDARAMVAAMSPRLDPERYVFCTGAAPIAEAIACFREAEGLSQIVPLDAAHEAGLDTRLVMARISLEVYSSLEGFGLTAAVSKALAEAQIACNMVAAYHHDHVFVPEADKHRAMDILRALQSS